MDIRTIRLSAGDVTLARDLFVMMSEVFETEVVALGDGYLHRLLSRPDFWAVAAFAEQKLVGGVTAHTLPMTRSESAELFIYDLAVRPEHQRKGVGRRLMSALREAAAAAGIHDVFVPADNEDEHALEFYRALGGDASPVTIFTFAAQKR